VATLLAGFGANTVSTTGNITGGYFFGNVSQANGFPATYGNSNAVAYGESGWAGNIIPSGNAIYSLGNATNQWNDLYVSNATIFMNNVPVSLSPGNVLTVNGNAVLQNDSNTSISTTGNITAGNISITGGSLTWSNASIVQTSASDVSITGDGQVTVRSLGGTYQWTFDSNGNLTAPANVSATGNVTGAYIKGNGSELTSLPAPVVTQDITSNGAMSIMTYDGNIKYVNYATVEPSSGNIAGGNITTTGLVSATGNITGNYFFGNGSQLTGINVSTSSISNGNSNVAIATANGNVTVAVAGAGTWTFDTTGNVTIPGNIVGTATIDIDNRATGNGADIQLYSADDILLQARDRSAGSTSEGGDINIFAGDSAEDSDSSGGDVVIEGGRGGASNVDFGGSGGTITIQGGQGGAASTGVDNYPAQDGGILTLRAGDAGGNMGNIDRGAAGGNVIIEAGDSTGNGVNGGTIYLTSGAADASALAGDVVIQAGGTWTFDGAGNLNLPMGGVVYETNIPDGGLSGSAIALKPTGGTNADQELLIYPTVNDANHLHLTTGNLYNTELFLGDDNLYVKLANTGNVVVNSNDDTGNTAQWTFGANGNLTLPGNIIAINYANGNRVTGGVTFNGEAVIGTGTSNTQSGLYLAPDPVSLTNDLYLRVRGNIIDEPTHIHFDTGNNQYFNQFIGDDNKYIQLANTGNIVINSNDAAGNSAQWIFNTAGTLTLPGGSRIRPLGANLDLFAGGGYVNLITADESSYMGVSGNGGFITTVSGTWQFDTTGNLSAPGNISAVGNIVSGNLTVGSGTITGGNVNGANFNGNVAFGTGTVGGSGNITGGNLITTGSGGAITMSGGNITGAGNISAGNISATGNVTAANFFGNGNTLSNVATTFESTWTVPVGNSTQNFTVPINNTYQLWVLGNIPNGIIVYNATVSVSNTNVPVIGQQFAWNYEGGGNILMFTSIPAQIIGTAGAIANAQPAVANTNVFSFGINNTSGNAVTVNYGYTKIS
jgi:hypothetical protein